MGASKLAYWPDVNILTRTHALSDLNSNSALIELLKVLELPHSSKADDE